MEDWKQSEKSESEGNARLAKVARFARERMEKVASERGEAIARLEYRWFHTLRVANWGKRLAEAEEGNPEQTIAACLLHDIAVFDAGEPGDHGRLGARISRPFLQELGYTPAQVDNICFAVATHVDGVADFEHPMKMEAKIVTDADNIDRFGPYRLVEYCLPHMQDYEKLIARLKDRLPTLERYRREQVLETRTGQEYFNQQLDLQIAVFKAMIAQYELTVLPNL
jgi:hypothetical protein